MNASTVFGSYFRDDTDVASLPPYFEIGRRSPRVGVVAMDSSDQTVVAFDEVTGVGACRTGMSIMRPNHEIARRIIGEVRYVAANPTTAVEEQLRGKLTYEHYFRLATGSRPFYASLKSAPPMTRPRVIAAAMRVVEDYRVVQTFSNSVYAVPGMLLTLDGRLNAQNFPGPPALDRQARLLRARGIRLVSVSKSGKLISVVRNYARTIRRLIGNPYVPFFFPILKKHLMHAYREGYSTSTPKTLRHGSSTSALGGSGAIRFALSFSKDNLNIVEMSLYDFEIFSGLVQSGESLEHFMSRYSGGRVSAIYSWDVLPFVTACDIERYVVPTLEEIVDTSYTDTELGIYPRPLADVHNHVKLRIDDPEIEAKRREICNDLARSGIPYELITLVPDGAHKTDPDEYNYDSYV